MSSNESQLNLNSWLAIILLQTTGEVMKIQITYETKVLLDTLGGFYCTPRGQVEVKGKGMMDTFWLEGRVWGGVSSQDLDLRQKLFG